MLRGGETVCQTKRYRMRKLRKGVQQLEMCEISGRERRIFVVAPIELLKSLVVVSFIQVRIDIRSLRF